MPSWGNGALVGLGLFFFQLEQAIADFSDRFRPYLVRSGLIRGHADQGGRTARLILQMG